MIMTDFSQSMQLQTEENTQYDDHGFRSRSDSLSSVLSSISQDRYAASSSTTSTTILVYDNKAAAAAAAEEEASKECCICYEMIDSGRNNCTTPCGHSFCFICIAKSMQVRNTCPCCRQPLYDASPISSTIPMIVEEENVSMTYTQDDHIEIPSSYDEWPPASMREQMRQRLNQRLVQHSLDPYDNDDTSYEVLNQNLRDYDQDQGQQQQQQHLVPMDVVEEEEENNNVNITATTISSIVFPEFPEYNSTPRHYVKYTTTTIA